MGQIQADSRIGRSRAAGVRGLPPRPRRRMLGSSSLEAAGREIPPRAVARIPIPARILRMTRFGLRHAGAGAGWWQRVEDAMERAVFAHLPPSARDLRLALDAEALTVVAEYRLPPAS